MYSHRIDDLWIIGLETDGLEAMAKPPTSKATALFGERVRQYRHALGISQEKLAERTDLHWSYIGQVERGQRNLTLHSIVRIAEALSVDPADLVRGLSSHD